MIQLASTAASIYFFQYSLGQDDSGAAGWAGLSVIPRLREHRVSTNFGNEARVFLRLNAKTAVVEEVPVGAGLTFHRFGLIISAVFALIAVVVSGYLIFRHCTHYLKPWEQRQ